MNDSSFASPTPVGDDSNNADAADREPASSTVATEAPDAADAAAGSDAAPARAFGFGLALTPPEPDPGAQWQAPPVNTPPARPSAPVGRLRKRTVTAVALGALLLGVVGGAGGAWAFDEWGPSGTSALPAAGGSQVERPEGSVAAVAAAVMPSVVSIESTSTGQRTSTGSGFVIREDGYILTNNHVVEGAIDDTVTVLNSDGSVVDGHVVGTTPEYDLAVVKIDATDLVPLVLGDSDKVVVGDQAIAIGSPLGLDSTVTTGIISALHRPVTAGDGTQEPAYIDAIQTDAAINPGNSGGPLINSEGEVIGINSAIASLGSTSTTAGSVGLGFAITSNQARRTADQLIENGEATFPVIGVLLDQRYTGEGIKVVDDKSGVIADGPAETAGVEPGDVITQIDGRTVTRSDELVVAIRAKAPGDDVVLTIKHGEDEHDVTVTLGANTDVGLDGGSAPEPSE